MNYTTPIISLLLGLGVGYFIGKGIGKEWIPDRVRDDIGDVQDDPSTSLRAGKETYIDDAEKKKNENLAKLREYLNTQPQLDNASQSNGAGLNNEEVRKLLNISDATACRYLDQLEAEGLIKQIGTDGPKVYYEKI